MFKKAHFIGLIVVVLVVAVLLKLPAQTMGKFKLAISGLFLPLFGLAGSSHDAVEKAGNLLVTRRELLEQNKRLQQENQQLRLLLTRDAELERENNRLRQSIGWKKQVAPPMKLGRVIAHDPANWWRSVQIDLGARDGIRVGLPARTIDGLVGRVQSVSETHAQIILLGDPNVRVSAIVGTTNRETGIVMTSSTSPQENNMVDLSYLPGSSAVSPGQTVTTLGDGGVFPAGIPIGRLVDKRSRDNGLTTEARVQLFANLAALEEVWVMMPTGEQATLERPAPNIERRPKPAVPSTSKGLTRPTSR
ncbi:MAG: rod shape-determining protein MreC [Limisphaerales bacterium]